MRSKIQLSWLAKLAVSFSILLMATLQSCSCAECGTDADCGDAEVCSDDGVCVTDGFDCSTCSANQLCDDSDGCLDDCEAEFMWDGDACVAVEGCNVCVVDNRVCADETAGTCGDCVADFEEDASGNCVPVANCDPPGTTGSLVMACEDDGRECEELPTGAECGDCLATHILVDDTCEETYLCADGQAADCQDDFRECMDDPNGTCGACLPGYLPVSNDDPETGCRAIQTCADLGCATICNPETETADAFCSESCTGPNNRPGIEDSTGFCVECGTCDGVGEDGPYLMALYAGTSCVCNSDPGFYYDPSLFGQQACDEDNDGWTRKSAELAYNSSDAVLTATFQCNVAVASNVELRAHTGASKTITVDPPAPLFEENRNDSQAELTQAGLIDYGARALLPNELNSLAKYCVGSGGLADYNGNGVPDVDEFHGMDLPQSGTIHEPFKNFTYFAELHRSWFDTDTIIIEEKSRLDGADASVATSLFLTEDGSGDDTYWRQCVVLEDPEFETVSTLGIDAVTFDFASYADEDPWDEQMMETGFVMGHHSQFKCLRVVAQADASDPRHYATIADLTGSTQWQLNSCGAAGTNALPEQNGPLGAGANPSDPSIDCIERPAAPAPALDDAIWAVRTYQDYTNSPYLGGCVNECEEFKPTCPGYNPDAPNNSQCDGTIGNYGQLTCGCNTNFGGPECDIPCPGYDPRGAAQPGVYNHLFVEQDYALAPRSGYWLCGSPSTTDTPVLDDGTADGYTLRGEVPAIATPQAPLTGDDGAGTTYTLSGYTGP